jgi:hypothetical protein
VRKIVAISLVLVGMLSVSVPEASAAVVTHVTSRWTTGIGWDRAGSYCDFTLKFGPGTIVGRYTFVRQDGRLVRAIDHEVRRGTYWNAQTGTTVSTLSRYTIASRRSPAPWRLTGAFMQVRAADGTLLLSSSGTALMADIHDSYVFLQRTKHATMVPQFTEVPGICELLGGHQVAN